MPAVSVNVTPKYESTFYDGTNGQDIADWFYNTTLTSEDENGIVINLPFDGPYAAPANVYFIRQDQGVFIGHYSIADYNKKWTEHIAAVHALGAGLIPTLLASAQTTVSVTLTTSFADDNYNASSVIIGSAGALSALEILSTTIVDENRVDIVVRNNGLLSISGAQVLVTCIKS